MILYITPYREKMIDDYITISTMIDYTYYITEWDTIVADTYEEYLSRYS
jgi:hypothetical protein